MEVATVLVLSTIYFVLLLKKDFQSHHYSFSNNIRVQMIDELLCSAGVPVYIVSKYGVLTKSSICIDKKSSNVEPRLQWRVLPPLSCEFSYITIITPPEAHESGFQMTFLLHDFKLTIEVNDRELATDMHACLNGYLQKAKSAVRAEKEQHTQKGTGQVTSSHQQTISLRKAVSDAAQKEEQLIQMCFYLRYKEAYMIVEKTRAKYLNEWKSVAFSHWVRVIKDANLPKMEKDRHRWRLHATANQEIDLQAWYHALFYLEVYRLRGHFWYKDAVLPVYKQSYDLVDNALTPLEEAALAHVLCSPDTSYGDVAGQMFVVQALIPPPQFTLFQQLAAQGATVVKYPRSGRPAKKTFRFSFVEGNIYLTWKGKFGNQGVGMGEVTSVVGGVQSDVLKWSVKDLSKADQYLSVNCLDRSVDLYFDTVTERNNWGDLLRTLVSKEQGVLVGVDPVDPPDDVPEFEWLVLYSSIGKQPHAEG